MTDLIRKALEAFDAAIDAVGGCADGYCVVKRPVGQHTNGGCRCAGDRWKANRVMSAAQKLRDALSSPSSYADGIEVAAKHHKGCAICGFTIDTRFAAVKPSVEFSTRGRK